VSFGGGEKKPGLSGLFGKESATSYDVYLNLTPLMDVMSNILFFLLAAFGATVVAILPTTVPVRSSDTSAKVEAQEEKVNVTIKAEASGLTVACDSPNVDPAKLREFAGRVGRKDGSYDHVALNALVKRIKERYPASKTVVLVPEDDMKYEIIVKIMDAVRDYRMPDGHRVELFPEVVLSSLVKK
jgi:biopolymer transport protein ExbD